MKQLLFKDEMVRQILAGKKTQTRRTHKKQKYFPGETVYVAETYRLGTDDIVFYKADYKTTLSCTKWKSKMFMPEKYSRIKLKITAAKKERICDISDSDAIAEGFAGQADFWRYFAQLHPEIPHNTEVWAYTFEVAK